MIVAAAMACSAAACGGTPGGPLPPFFTDGPVQPEIDGGAPPSTDGAVQPGSDAPPPKTGVCPSLAGGWVGPLSGTITGLGSVAVTGSVKLVLTAAQAKGDYAITSGEWVTAPKSSPNLQAKAPISGGTVRCGKLSLNTTAVIFGVKTAGTFACTFGDGSGCKGTWSGKATDGSGSAGAGNFELRRK